MDIDKQFIRIIIIAALASSACSPPAKYRFVCSRGSGPTFSTVVYSANKHQKGVHTVWQLGLFPSGSVNYQEHPDESCRRVLVDRTGESRIREIHGASIERRPIAP